MIAPLAERVPPRKYGGIERFIHTLTEGLVKKGYDVTLFASGDSWTSAKLISVHYKSLRASGKMNPYNANYLSMLNIGNAYNMQDNFDIIHDNNDFLSLPTATLATTPVIFTVHGALIGERKKLYERLGREGNPYLVSISNAQRAPSPNLNYIANIYHGINLKEFPYSEKSGKYLLYVGRIDEEKGVHNAIEVAEKLDMDFIIAAKVDAFGKEYFQSKIKPHLTNKIRWIGEVDTQERNKLMRNAICFLHPVSWREPFGLTLIEAMACGTPVVAFGRGSIPELIKNGKTGFVVDSINEMAEKVKQIKKIKRIDCRIHVENNFSSDKMVSEYIKVYKNILSQGKAQQHSATRSSSASFLT